jgi:hypothetical protein
MIFLLSDVFLEKRPNIPLPDRVIKAPPPFRYEGKAG